MIQILNVKEVSPEEIFARPEDKRDVAGTVSTGEFSFSMNCAIFLAMIEKNRMNHMTMNTVPKISIQTLLFV